jgi:hypothetical protein
MSSEVWLPIATLVLGIVLGYVADWLREERSSRREREERWKAFQRESILEAQDLLWDLITANMEAGRAAKAHFRATGEWPDDEFEYDLSLVMKSLNAQARLLVLASRIEDRELASMIEDFNEATRQMGPPRDLASHQAAGDQASETMHNFNKRVSELLPALH